MSEKVILILLAGGSGSRMAAPVNKVLLPIAGIPCIARSASAFESFADRMILVGRPEEQDALTGAVRHSGFSHPVTFVPGGTTRQESVSHALSALSGEEENAVVLIHDGARCLVEERIIAEVVASVREFGSGVASVPVTDTIREAVPGTEAWRLIPRENLRAMQTPQGFRLSPLLRAFRLAEEQGFEGTDDAAVMERAGYQVRYTEGGRNNLKITVREDLLMAEKILENHDFPSVRIGQGYDVHQLCEGRKLVLCGVEIPYGLGLLGHSDADVALHALMDALLGAAGLGDIGRHFPDSDDKYRGISSMKLLNAVMDKLRAAGFRPANADVTIVAQKPKLAPFIPQMEENLASALNLPLSRINVKATTTEHLGFEGRMEGISAQAVCLIQAASDS